MRRCLSAFERGIHRSRVTSDHVLVESVFVESFSLLAIEPRNICLVVTKKRFVTSFDVKVVCPQSGVHCRKSAVCTHFDLRLVWRGIPGPRIPEPELRQDVQLGCFCPTILNRDLDQDVVGGGLGLFDEHIPIPVVVEYARVNQLEFIVLQATRPVLLQ